MIDLVLNNFTTDRSCGKEFFEKVVEKVVKETGFDGKKVELSINVVGEGRIKQLNKKHRGRNRVTDVLSFPLQVRVNADRTQKTADKRSRAFAKNVTNDIISLGDIFICLPVAKKYAQREGVSLDFKMAFLTVHGFLHLLGYDHEKSTTEKDRMFDLQDRILNKLDF